MHAAILPQIPARYQSVTRPAVPVVNRVEMRVVGMSRSGNHAIIDWILAQSPGATCFLNCAEPGTNPFRTRRPLDARGIGHRTTIAGFDPEAEAARRWSPKDLLLHSYEDTFLGPFGRGDAEAAHEANVGRSSRRIDVLVLRDPYNLFASRRASGYGGVRPATAVRIWCQHAREFLGERRHLANERVMVSFNRWATEPIYRSALAGALGLQHDADAGRSVARCAGGSSFDGTAFDGRAGEMRVLERWRTAGDDPRYHALFTPPLVTLSRRIFGDVTAESPAPLPLAA